MQRLARVHGGHAEARDGRHARVERRRLLGRAHARHEVRDARLERQRRVAVGEAAEGRVRAARRGVGGLHAQGRRRERRDDVPASGRHGELLRRVARVARVDADGRAEGRRAARGVDVAGAEAQAVVERHDTRAADGELLVRHGRVVRAPHVQRRAARVRGARDVEDEVAAAVAQDVPRQGAAVGADEREGLARRVRAALEQQDSVADRHGRRAAREREEERGAPRAAAGAGGAARHLAIPQLSACCPRNAEAKKRRLGLTTVVTKQRRALRSCKLCQSKAHLIRPGIVPLSSACRLWCDSRKTQPVRCALS